METCQWCDKNPVLKGEKICWDCYHSKNGWLLAKSTFAKSKDEYIKFMLKGRFFFKILRAPLWFLCTEEQYENWSVRFVNGSKDIIEEIYLGEEITEEFYDIRFVILVLKNNDKQAYCPLGIFQYREEVSQYPHKRIFIYRDEYQVYDIWKKRLRTVNKDCKETGNLLELKYENHNHTKEK